MGFQFHKDGIIIVMQTYNSLRKYTSMPILFDMLVNRKITLVDPASWEDRNDAFFLERYRERKKLKTILAICFTNKLETFHHWKVFAGYPGGVCIRFNADILMACFDHVPGIRHGLVTYRLIRDLKRNAPTEDELPFLKRKQYADEAEFRILYENEKKKFKEKRFALDLRSIERITLGPWIPNSVCKTVKEVIRSIPECSSMEIIHTGIVESSSWKNIAISLA